MDPTVIIGRVGQRCGVVYRNHGAAWITDNALYARRFKRPVDVDFMALALESARLNDVKNKNDLPLITQGILKDVKILLPDSLEEQRHIATAVADADLLIERLERLIAKRQAIKQGLMQQLLTGLARLPGFSGPWVRRIVSELIDGLEAGVSVRSTTTSGGPSILKTSAVDKGRFVPTEAKPILAADLLRARCTPVGGSMIISRMNTPALVGDVAYVAASRSDLFLPDRLWLARQRRGTSTDMRWLTYYFSSGPGILRLRELATGTSGSMKNIPKSRLLALDVDTPSEPEQRAIANCLADADAELEVLGKRLAKARAIKTGMMQQLLTGRTRLPVEASS